jgi:DNA mismatch repair protein MutH
MALTRLYIRSLLLSDTFYEAVQAKHLTMGNDFKRVPAGQVLFSIMMVLDACHASGIEQDFEEARKALETMPLEDFPSEDVSNFATSAQKKIKILLSDYALPIDLGSQSWFER